MNLDFSHTWRRAAAGRTLSLRTALTMHNVFDEDVFDAFGLPGAGRLTRLEFRLH